MFWWQYKVSPRFKVAKSLESSANPAGPGRLHLGQRRIDGFGQFLRDGNPRFWSRNRCGFRQQKSSGSEKCQQLCNWGNLQKERNHRTRILEKHRNQCVCRDSFHSSLAQHQPNRVLNNKECPIDPILPGGVFNPSPKRSLLFWVYPPKDYQPLSSWLISSEQNIRTNGTIRQYSIVSRVDLPMEFHYLSYVMT